MPAEPRISCRSETGTLVQKAGESAMKVLKKTAFPFIHYFSLSQRVMVFLFAIIYQTACRQWMCSIVPSSLEDNK